MSCASIPILDLIAVSQNVDALVQKRKWSMNSSEGIHQMSAKFIMYLIHNAPSASERY